MGGRSPGPVRSLTKDSSGTGTCEACSALIGGSEGDIGRAAITAQWTMQDAGDPVFEC